ncbi:hypothetical protein Tco_0233045 [Tanacetum coccineum]
MHHSSICKQSYHHEFQDRCLLSKERTYDFIELRVSFNLFVDASEYLWDDYRCYLLVLCLGSCLKIITVHSSIQSTNLASLEHHEAQEMSIWYCREAHMLRCFLIVSSLHCQQLKFSVQKGPEEGSGSVVEWSTLVILPLLMIGIRSAVTDGGGGWFSA